MRVIRCAEDAKDCDFLVVDDFLGKFACDHLADVYRDSSSLYETYHRDPFWKGRLLGHRDIHDPDATGFMRYVVSRAQSVGMGFYDAPTLYPDVLHVVGWPQGIRMTPHADNAHESGEIHEFHWRDYSGVLYLNDDFEGGGLYLPKQDILIEPRKDMFVSLPCGLSHMHGVNEVTSGLRITLAFFLTTDISRTDRDLIMERAR